MFFNSSRTGASRLDHDRICWPLAQPHVRYYDPVLGRFLSPDAVVPGAANGSLEGVALKPLTVNFNEPGLLARLNAENKGGAEKLYRGGPLNPQALNRYSYVVNNPVRYTDPSGHLYNGGDRTVGYRSACTNNAGAVVGCDTPGAKLISDPEKGELVETWTSDGMYYTYTYYWSNTDEFAQFQAFADAAYSAKISFLEAVGVTGAAADTAIPSCAAAATVVGGIICGAALVGGVVAGGYAVIQWFAWNENWKWAQLQQQYYPGVTIPGTSARPHRSRRDPYQ